MFIRNINDFNENDLYKCYDEDFYTFLYNVKNIVHINKGNDNKGQFWIYLNTDLLQLALAEYDVLKGGESIE